MWAALSDLVVITPPAAFSSLPFRVTVRFSLVVSFPSTFFHGLLPFDRFTSVTGLLSIPSTVTASPAFAPSGGISTSIFECSSLDAHTHVPVSYTHLTLPTICSV
eukprot:TRINITY_DN14833_c0_g4_i1.p4 TRINITY_DN14833_c0_g4~~TRINITY_DN14833_c0_g4_i1.p4  ORF type:complete len:105 (-),score=11.27 TRINITY_DN14833_c0_g4_i1:42-356(-)